MTLADWVDDMVAENKQLKAEVELRGFKVTNLTTERDVANQEIERLIRIQPDLPTEQAAIGELRQEIERLKIGQPPVIPNSAEYWYQECIEINKRIDEQAAIHEGLESQLTASRAKVEKLRSEIQRVIVGDGSNVHRNACNCLLHQALADTEGK